MATRIATVSVTVELEIIVDDATLTIMKHGNVHDALWRAALLNPIESGVRKMEVECAQVLNVDDADE
jgi:hypothetical protein